MLLGPKLGCWKVGVGPLQRHAGSQLNELRFRCALLAVVHDLAEAQVGDIAPSDGISKQDKRKLEAAAMDNIINEMLGGEAAAQRIRSLWDVRLA